MRPLHLLLLTTLVSVSPSLHGGIIVSNLNLLEETGVRYWPIGTGAISVFDPGVYESVDLSFTTDGNEYRLDAVNVEVFTIFVGPNDPLKVSLYNNVSDPLQNLPDTFIADLSGSTSPNGLTTYSPISTIHLEANTKYHVVLSAGADSSYRWATLPFFVDYNSTPTSGPGSISRSLNYYFTDDANPAILYTATNYIPRMSIEGTVVPEAPSWVILASAGVLFLPFSILRSRNVKQAA
ncbi:hypothetical protein K2Y11_11070 [bacterium]|nr:hypothetical protein [bacterium]